MDLDRRKPDRSPSVRAGIRRGLRLGSLLATLSAFCTPALASEIDWARHSDVRTIKIVTLADDGEPHSTTVWLAVVESQPYLHGGDRRWLTRALANPPATLEIENERHPVTLEHVTDDALADTVRQTFRSKYGWVDAFVTWAFGSNDNILRITPVAP